MCKGCGHRLYIGNSQTCVSCGHKAGFLAILRADLSKTDENARSKRESDRIEEANKPVWYTQANGVRAMRERPSPRPVVPTPASGRHGLTWQEAEQLACDWMRTHGYPDARVTPAGADGGIDVRSRDAIAQVKHHNRPIGISEMQRIYGIVASSGKKALFFSASGYTAAALKWANANSVECYAYPPVERVYA